MGIFSVSEPDERCHAFDCAPVAGAPSPNGLSRHPVECDWGSTDCPAVTESPVRPPEALASFRLAHPLPMLQAVLVRSDSAEALEGPDEMAVVEKPDRLRDIGDEPGRVLEQFPRGVDARQEDVIHRRHFKELLKAAPELAA